MPARRLLRQRWLSVCLTGLLGLAQLGAILHGAEHAQLASDLSCPLCLASGHLSGPPPHAAAFVRLQPTLPVVAERAAQPSRERTIAYRQRAPPAHLV